MQYCMILAVLAVAFAADNYDTTFRLPQSLIPVDSRDWCMENCTNSTLDCSGHGTCACKIDRLTTVGESCVDAEAPLTHCKCDIGWSGADCSECKWGWVSDVDGNQCSQCAENFGPAEQCDRYCTDDMCQQGGRCKVGTGVCECVGGFGGHHCTRCASPFQMWPDCECNVTCGRGGGCATGGLSCQCYPGFTGDNCDQCKKAGEKFPLCGSLSSSSKMGAGDSSECEGGSVALPVILSILGTALALGGGAAAYTVWKNKQGGTGGGAKAESSNWQNFEDEGMTGYSKL